MVGLGDVAKHYSDTQDEVIGTNGKTFRTNQATIWRWSEAFQNDFAARMQWTLTPDRSTVNHAPVVIVNGHEGPEPLYIDAEVETEIVLDASESYDPDGDDLTFRWFQYKEPTKAQSLIYWSQVAEVNFQRVEDEKNGSMVIVKVPPPVQCAVAVMTGKALSKGQALHLILEVKDNGAPSMVTYKRVVLQVTNRDLQGGTNKSYDTASEALGHHVR
ncbi:hypothetical protein N7540_004348 [Penicillium herquei]|nr:hypothetical protein N7540_004348 [Penicillium herquei]